MYVKFNNIPKCFLKNKVLIIDSFEKIHSLIDIVNKLIPNKPSLSILETHLGLCGGLFVSETTNIILERYYFEKKYNVSSFGNDYDQVPDWWKYFVNVIENELSLIREIKEVDQKGDK